MSICEMCANYCYYEDFEEYYCDVDLDEDEYMRFLSSSEKMQPQYFCIYKPSSLAFACPSRNPFRKSR